jgi:aldehyde dehydrogenase (NAD+)
LSHTAKSSHTGFGNFVKTLNIKAMKVINGTYINGKFTQPHGQEIVNIISPLDESILGTLQYSNAEDTKAAIEAANVAFEKYAKTTIEERKTYLQRIHDELLKKVDELVEATITEYGAPMERALWSNKLSAEVFLSYIKVLDEYHFEKKVNESTVIMEPVGVSALFTPWNATAGSIAVKVAAALAAGCTVVLKPSEFTPWQAQLVMEAIDKAGLPKGVVNMVNGRGDIIGGTIMSSNKVQKISFTGSTQVGKLLARQAVDTMKRVTLELSGKSANIILEDADLSAAIPLALQAAFMNNGQACIAGSRLLVPENKITEVEAALVAAAASFKVGHPRSEGTKIGPLANKKQFDRIQTYINIGINEGAKLLYGGPGAPGGLEKGYYVKPTIFTGVTNQMQIAREEIFGPVLSVIPYRDEQEAVAIANDSPYGLLAYISTKDLFHGRKIAAQLKAGRVLLNTLKHDSLAPFGGYKESGIGRENGVFGLEDFLEAKTLIE